MIVLFFGLLTSGMTQAADGIIHFYGQIIDGGCTTNSSENVVTSSCFQGGKTAEISQKVSVGAIESAKLPLDLGTVSTRPVANHPNLLITTISYN
ncbi:hypothetical protein [Rouxiella sp. Mn2063]|uniref:hypothetical protein n=1 Tax=Rouxiella sp. Mn2063 TaxID=3395262 RepID=UPI003BCA707A